MSHPELSALQDDIRKLAGRFQDLGRIGRGSSAAAYRSIQNANGGNMADPLAWSGALERTFPDPIERERHRRSVLAYTTQNTRWQPPPPPQAPPAEGGGSGGGAGALAALVGSPDVRQAKLAHRVVDLSKRATGPR
jgi:hypothetical protein